MGEVLIPSSKSKSIPETGEETRRADCIVLIYDMTSSIAVDNLLVFWIPFIQNYNRKIPILLLGNKLDLVKKNEDKFVGQRIRRVANQIFKKTDVKIEIKITISNWSCVLSAQ
jgi:GTPase SAR1 family protein